MNLIDNSLARVIKDYVAPYADPIQVKAGDEITIDDSKKTPLNGWIWCINLAEKSGWVPEAYINRQGNTGHICCDYDAIELTICVGEILTLYREESGFFWATNESGQSGWVPSNHLDSTQEADYFIGTIE